MAVNRSTEFVTLWAAPVMKYVLMEPLNRACARSAVLRLMNCRLPVHQSQRVQHIRDLLCILLRKTDRLLAFDASGLIREPVVDCPTFAILAHVEANDGHGALEGDDPLI